MRKIDDYKVKTGVNLASLKFWNTILEDIDLRIHARELDAEAINKAADELIAVGIARVNQTFNPLIQQSQQAMQDAIALLETAQQQMTDTIEDVNADLQQFLSETAAQVQAILAGGVDGGTIEEPAGAKIKLLHSTVTGHAPTTLEVGEVAINQADGLFFFRKSDGTVGSLDLVTAATQAWTATQIGNAITALKGGVGSALDTLDELAAALGDDVNYASSVTTALANRLRFDAEQTLTAGQKTQLRANAGLGAAADKAIALAAAIRAGSGSDALTTDQAWAAAEWVNLGNLTGNVDIDFATGTNFYGTLTGNVTLTFHNLKNGQPAMVWLLQDATGGRTISYTANKFLFPNGTAPTANATASQTAVVISGKGSATGSQMHATGWKVN